ncbi:MAG: C39 family peptidase, partial [Planctomycetota bacterium]|nr:C39 family peptidase [Planctomycetota bacterium]
MSSHFLFLLTAVSVGSLSPEVARPSYSDVLIDGVPHVRQKPDFCGEACAEMYLRKLGRPFAQDDVFGASGLDPLLGRGCHTRELERALRRIGFKVGRVWERIDARRASHGLEKLWRDLHADLVRGIPSIVCTRYDGKPKTTEHFRLVLGYDSEKDEVIYHEPAEPRGSYRRMTRSLFLGLWPLKYDPARWTVVRLRLEPDGLLERLPREWTSFPGAKYARHLMELRRKLSKLPTGRNFTVVMEPPFVVVG